MSRTYRFGRFNKVMNGYTGDQIREGWEGDFDFYMSLYHDADRALEKAFDHFNRSCDWALKSLRDQDHGTWKRSFKTETKRRARRHTDAVLHNIKAEHAARFDGENNNSWDDALVNYHHRPWHDSPTLLVETADLHGYKRFSDIWAWD